MKVSTFYRIAAVLILLFDIGHTIGFLQRDPEWKVDSLLLSMKSTHFDIQGFSRSYWDFFVGFGLFVTVFLLLAAVLAWQLGGVALENFGTHARHRMGVRTLLWRHHGSELEILLRYPDRLVIRDFAVSDSGGMAFSEARTHLRGALSDYW